MRKIIVSLHTSFDGVMSGAPPDGKVQVDMGPQSYHMDWTTPGVMDSWVDVLKIFNEVDTILLGRTTYEGLRQFWPTQTDAFGERMNKIPKIVFAHSGLKEVCSGRRRPTHLESG